MDSPSLTILTPRSPGFFCSERSPLAQSELTQGISIASTTMEVSLDDHNSPFCLMNLPSTPFIPHLATKELGLC